MMMMRHATWCLEKIMAGESFGHLLKSQCYLQRRKKNAKNKNYCTCCKDGKSKLSHNRVCHILWQLAIAVQFSSVQVPSASPQKQKRQRVACAQNVPQKVQICGSFANLCHTEKSKGLTRCLPMRIVEQKVTIVTIIV